MLKSMILAAPALAWAGLAFAAMEDPKPKPAVECAEGKVYDEKTKTCIAPSNALLDDATLFVAGENFAKTGRYDEAIAALNEIRNANTAEVQTVLGYAIRKSGDFEEGLKHYAIALNLDPNHHLARAYLGMALIERGDPVGALAQLREIEARGGSDTYAHAELVRAIETGGAYR